MRVLSQDEFHEMAEQYVRMIFSSYDPQDEPFAAAVSSRLLLYPFQYRVHSPWLKPFVAALGELGEEYFFVSIVGWEQPVSHNQPYHWIVPVQDADTYDMQVGAAEHILYSCRGTWGITCSHEDHALLGGTPVLIEAIIRAVPDLDERVYEFLDLWRHYHEQNNADVTWIPALLSHIYGRDIAVRLVKRASLWKATRGEG